METQEKKRFYIGDVMVFSFKKLKENFLVLLVIYLGVNTIQMAYSKLSGEIVKNISTLDNMDIYQAIAAIPYILISLLLSVAILRISLKIYDKGKISFNDLKPDFNGYWKYVAAMLLFAVFIAVIILILPAIAKGLEADQGLFSILFLASLVTAIIYMIKLHLFGYFIIDRKQGIFESFKSSAETTRGIKAGIFGFFFVLAVPIIIYVISVMMSVYGNMPPAQIIVYLSAKLEFLIPLHALLFIIYSIVIVGGAYIYRSYADWKPQTQAVENESKEISDNQD